jgi:hypothetical protein
MHGSEPGSSDARPSIGWGLLAFFGLPILAIVALVTIVGIPLGRAAVRRMLWCGG